MIRALYFHEGYGMTDQYVAFIFNEKIRGEIQLDSAGEEKIDFTNLESRIKGYAHLFIHAGVDNQEYLMGEFIPRYQGDIDIVLVTFSPEDYQVTEDGLTLLGLPLHQDRIPQLFYEHITRTTSR